MHVSVKFFLFTISVYKAQSFFNDMDNYAPKIITKIKHTFITFTLKDAMPVSFRSELFYILHSNYI